MANTENNIISHHSNRPRISAQLEPWCDMSDKVVLVTGASSGLGTEFCLDLAKAGCRILAVARRIDLLQSLCDEINKLNPSSSAVIGPQAIALELDVSADDASIQKSVKKAWDAFGWIDALVNNAGIRGNVNSSLDTPEEEWDNVFKTNLTGSWLVSKHVCKLMREAKCKGVVINISSVSGLPRTVARGGVAYSASKAGVNFMTKMMAIELGPHNIRVNSIAPGLFRSEITAGLMQKDWLTNVAKRTVPLRDYGTANPALTSLVRYLIHDSSEYISGNIFIVDAGDTLPGTPIFSSL